MPENLKVGRKWKADQLDWDVVSTFDTTQENAVCLTQQEQSIIITALQVFTWRTRWTNLPEDQNLSVIDNLIGKMMCIDGCCDVVAMCLKRPDIIKIIEEIIRGGGTGGGGGGTGGGQVNTCDPDVIWSAVSYLVDYQIEKMFDFLEKFEVATNLLEIADQWTAIAGPVMSAFAVRLLDWLTWFQDNIAENYASAITIEYRNEVKCELFCLYLQDCPTMPTWKDIGIFWMNRVGEETWYENMFDLATFMIGGFWTGSQIADIMHMAQVAFQIVEDSIGWLNISDMAQLDVVFALGANNPDSDWELLCETCTNQYSYCWFVPDGNTPAWTAEDRGDSTPLAVYDATNQWFRAMASPINNSGKFGGVSYDLGQEYSTVVVEASIDVKPSRLSGSANLAIARGDNTQSGSTGGDLPAGTPDTLSLTRTLTNCQTILVAWNCATLLSSENETTSYSRLRYIKVTVTGTVSPFPEGNCPVE